NKIAGTDRRDQVILDGWHIATLWFDITTGAHKLDLEPAGASLLAARAERGVVLCHEKLLKGHLKGKWLSAEQIACQPENLVEGSNVVLRMGKFAGVGTVRKRSDGSGSIRIKDVTRTGFVISDNHPTLKDVIAANENSLERLEKTALWELRGYISRTRLPVNISFSGGKDSLASLCLCRKAMPGAEVLFVNTGLEFPETVAYVRNFCRAHSLKLHEIEGESDFFSNVKTFGPPAKDFRWCCKTNKLGPMTSFLKQRYPKGCVTIEGRRIYESFNRSTIRAVERNPYVPNQTTLSPIRNWRALEVMLYIYWNSLEPNPLYDQDFERIGCWLCPASLQSEFSHLKKSHPQLHAKWTSSLQAWAEENKLDSRYIDWGFWRWRRHPPKMIEIAKANDIELQARPKEKNDIKLEIVQGRSPCGLEYSIEATLHVPQNHPFSAVSGALNMLGKVSYAEDLGAAVIKSEKGRATVFANGQLMVIAPKEEAKKLLGKIFEIILRVQMCTGCKICERSCKRGAIVVRDTFSVNENLCNRCGKCSQSCIVADQAAKMSRRFAASTFK
ncbi:MAG: phosphoadenosine phosphosulfate reductase family protein, partial [Methanothrix sp.]|nr:phosphoadenosine phosphosulfate reductase family protein [Methanothrix sp.]